MNHETHHPATSHTGVSSWSDFNDAEAQQGEFNLIPKGTQALVRMAIKPGGHDDASRGWSGGYATASEETGAVFLSCEFVVLSGAFAKRKIWSNVGLHSNKGPTWAQMGRSFVKAVLNSARSIHPQDASPEAQRARQIRSFAELDGVEFAARIGIEKDGKGELRNVIRLVIEPDHKDYAELMAFKRERETGGGNSGAPLASPVAIAPTTAHHHAPRVPSTSSTQGRPVWAQ